MVKHLTQQVILTLHQQVAPVLPELYRTADLVTDALHPAHHLGAQPAQIQRFPLKRTASVRQTAQRLQRIQHSQQRVIALALYALILTGFFLRALPVGLCQQLADTDQTAQRQAHPLRHLRQPLQRHSDRRRTQCQTDQQSRLQSFRPAHPVFSGQFQRLHTHPVDRPQRLRKGGLFLQRPAAPLRQCGCRSVVIGRVSIVRKDHRLRTGIKPCRAGKFEITHSLTPLTPLRIRLPMLMGRLFKLSIANPSTRRKKDVESCRILPKPPACMKGFF